MKEIHNKRILGGRIFGNDRSCGVRYLNFLAIYIMKQYN